MKIAIIGTGNMGGGIARGLLSQGVCAAEDLACTARSEKTRERLERELRGARISSDNRAAARGAEIVFLAVKPPLVETVLAEIRDELSAGAPTLVSVAAGISLARLRECAGPSPSVFVAIPNTAVAVAQSMTFVSAEENAPEARTRRVLEIFSRLGRAELVPENRLAAGTALASCGIAFAMRYVRAATAGGVELGLPAELAKNAVLQTLKGAAELLAETREHPESAIDKVCTPGGITIRGLNKMEECGFSSAVVQGLRACR